MSANHPIHLLLIEDDPDDVLLFNEALAETRTQRFQVTHAGRLDTGLDRIAEGGMDVVLLDLNLPDSHGLETLKTLLSHTTRVPVVVMSGLEDETLALEAVQQGAQDYLVKGKADGETIAHIVNYAIERHRLVQNLQVSETRTHAIIENSMDGILIVDDQGVVRFVNPAAESLFGRPAEQLVGDTFGFPIVTDKVIELEILRPDGSGSMRVAEIRATELIWDGQTAYLASLRDISERKQAEKLLREKSAALLVEIVEHKRLQVELQALSLHDELTGLCNRRGFMTLAEQHWRLALRIRQGFVILYMDMDGLKHINDTFGHTAGDQALQMAARAMEQSFRESDILARLGGDEFSVLVADCDQASIKVAITRLEQSLSLAKADGTSLPPLSLSIGLALFDPNDQTAISELLEQADAAMYVQKQRSRGRNQQKVIKKEVKH